jgi:FAD/FMN-containing dehydrogenase
MIGLVTNTNAYQCSRLVSALGSHVKSRGSALYNESNSYWAEQQNLQSPSCVVLPTNAHDVSSVLVTLVKNSCSFAIRGGGHSSTKGASNIDGGVVIDMRGLNSTTLNADNSLVTVGAGQTWGPAYSILQAAGVTIPGGRNNAIGIGGSILGGMYSILYEVRPGQAD